MDTQQEPRPTPLLDKVTIARFTTDDFDLTENELVALADPAVRYAFCDALQSTVAWETIIEVGLQRWRERREDS